MGDTLSDFNQQVIEEFRANGGKVGGYFEGANMILITTTGAKSGLQRTIPLVYFKDGERVLIIASKGGAPAHPDWYHNLKANPVATVEIGTDTYEAKAVELALDDRNDVYTRIAEAMPNFGEYQQNTTRIIPVLELVRAS
jgi:deazaflavin-dependent oxidoreductase (nitroreductase family)